MAATLKLFYIGRHFYEASKTMMSPIYEEGTFNRCDWGKVQIALEQGMNVSIRQATDEELARATRKLQEISALG